MREKKLVGKVVVVCGASRGIGLCVAQALARRGARVVLAARSEVEIERHAAELRAQGHDASAQTIDVRDVPSTRAAVARVIARHGRVDAWVQCAGNGGSLSRWEDSGSEHLLDMFDVHVFGAERSLRALTPQLRAQGGGTFVLVSSTVGWVPMPGGAAYSAAKAAVNALAEVWRAELASAGIDVRVFAPPHTRTEAGEQWPLPLPKIFEPAWVAEQMCDFLAGSRARAVVGGNGALLVLQRLWPAWAARIMRRIGFTALARAELQAGRTATPRIR